MMAHSLLSISLSVPFIVIVKYAEISNPVYSYSVCVRVTSISKSGILAISQVTVFGSVEPSAHLKSLFSVSVAVCVPALIALPFVTV